jgi:hypothetical protein
MNNNPCATEAPEFAMLINQFRNELTRMEGNSQSINERVKALKNIPSPAIKG